MPYEQSQFEAVTKEIVQAIRHQHPVRLDDFDPVSGAGQVIIDLRHAMTSRPPYRRLPGLNVSRFTRQLKAYFKRSSLASLRHIINPKYGYEFRSGNVSGYNYNYTKVVFYLKG